MKRFFEGLYKKNRVRNDPRSGKCDYNSLFLLLNNQFGEEDAVKKGVGGEFEAFGQVELALLVSLGLRPEHSLIDVGCGSGRLAVPLSHYLKGSYLGTDVVASFLDHARSAVKHPEWRFELVDQLVIPVSDEHADFVCFFSVLTHLLHEQSFVYLQEARRVLKPGGAIVFSFLDFLISEHWPVFELNVNDVAKNQHPLNIFLWKDAIRVWADRLGLKVERFIEGTSPEIPLTAPVVFSSGGVVRDHCAFGQSVCVLRKP